MTQLMDMETAATVLGTPAKELAFRVHSPHASAAAQVVVLAGQKVSIGADPQCTLRLAGNKVEPCYCLVLRGESSDVIRSLSPRAKLNGADFQDAALQAGDRLQLDDVELEVLAAPDTPERDFAAEQRVLDALAEEQRQRGETLETQFAELQRREQSVREREAELVAMAETLGRDQTIFHEQRAAFAEEREATARHAAEASERRAAELRQQGDAVEARFGEAERLERTLRELEAKLAEDRQRLEDGRRELEDGRRNLDEQRAAFNAERETSVQQVSESSRQELEELQRCVESFDVRERKFEAEKHELELEIRTLQAEREQSQSTRAQLEAERAQVVADRAEIQTLARQFEAESQAAEEARAALADMERKLKATQSELAGRQQAGNGNATISSADMKAEREREQYREEREAWEQERRRWDQECERWERESREFQAELEERERTVQQSLTELETEREKLTLIEQQIAARYEEVEAAATLTAEEDRRSTSRPASEAGEDEDSIHDYMQQLLQRASAKPTARQTSHSHEPSRESKPAKVEAVSDKPAAPVEQRTRRPDRPKADQAVDLSTLREIANLTAKGALDRHSEKQSAQRRLNRVLLGGGGTAFVMIVLACLGFFPTVTAALAVAATAVAFLGWRQYQMSLRRFAVGAAEKAAGATLAADIAAADEESHVTPAG